MLVHCVAHEPYYTGASVDTNYNYTNIMNIGTVKKKNLN
jgi:hypothetical protein